MQTIQFESDTRDGVVKLPEKYKEWHNKNVKVILVRESETNANINAVKEHALKEFFKRFNAVLGVYRFDRNEANER